MGDFNMQPNMQPNKHLNTMDTARLDGWVTSGLPYLGVILLAVLFLFFGHRLATRDMVRYQYENEVENVRVRITDVVSVTDHASGFDAWQIFIFEGEVLTRGPLQGELVTFQQSTRGFFYERFARVARPGDRVILALLSNGDFSLIDFVRLQYIVVLAILFMLLLVVFGRFKGFNALLSLGFTGVGVFGVFIPAVLSGRNIYLWAILICIYATFTTIFVVSGVNKKSLSAVLGCLGGVLGAGLLTFIMARVMELTGITQNESRLLLQLFDDGRPPIDLNAIIFAGIIIGAVGAIMDIAISIASALWELKRQKPHVEFWDMFKSGINIGKDILGSSMNTLVLAYIGSSLTLVLFLVSHFNSLLRVLNRELVLVELLQAIVGGVGIFLTMPLTALICALLLGSAKAPTVSPTVSPGMPTKM